MKFPPTLLPPDLNGSLDGNKHLMLSHKEKKILATRRERDRKEAEKRRMFQENVQTLQELQKLLLQVRPDLVGPSQTQLKTKERQGRKEDNNKKDITDNEATALPELEVRENSADAEDDEYVTNFDPEVVEDDYYYL